MISTPPLNLTHQVVAAVAPPPVALVPAPLAAPRVTPTLLASIPNTYHPHPSHSPAVTPMLLMKHGKIFISHIHSPCTISRASSMHSSAPLSPSRLKSLS